MYNHKWNKVTCSCWSIRTRLSSWTLKNSTNRIRNLSNAASCDWRSSSCLNEVGFCLDPIATFCVAFSMSDGSSESSFRPLNSLRAVISSRMTLETENKWLTAKIYMVLRLSDKCRGLTRCASRDNRTWGATFLKLVRSLYAFFKGPWSFSLGFVL